MLGGIGGCQSGTAEHDGADLCPLCESIAGRGRDELDFAWERSDQVAVLPAWGHVAVGHVMVCSTVHVPNLAAADARLAEAALATVQRLVGELTIALDQECFVFEHGYRKGARTGRSGETDCSINHLHIHIVPVIPSVMRALEAELDGFEEVGRVSLSAMAETDDYLLAGIGGRSWYRSPPGFTIRSRHFLKRIAMLVDRPESWDEAVVDPRPLIQHSKELLYPLSVSTR